MITQLNLDGFEHVSEMEYHGKVYKSIYNHNYYYNTEKDILIYEECDDDIFYIYTNIKNNEHLGNITSVWGIFEKYFTDFITIEGKRYAILDTNCT